MLHKCVRESFAQKLNFGMSLLHFVSLKMLLVVPVDEKGAMSDGPTLTAFVGGDNSVKRLELHICLRCLMQNVAWHKARRLEA